MMITVLLLSGLVMQLGMMFLIVMALNGLVLWLFKPTGAIRYDVFDSYSVEWLFSVMVIYVVE